MTQGDGAGYRMVQLLGIQEEPGMVQMVARLYIQLENSHKRVETL